jgi:metal-responsive CopG/Arc/MetJ family transcriptional regulator
VAKSHRVNVNFSEGAYKTLDELARRKGKSMSEVLRDAISLEKWFEDTREEGGRVLVERDGEAREVIPR